MQGFALTSFDVEVAAGSVMPLAVSGELFVCRESSRGFKISFNDGPAIDFEAGFSIRPPGGFTRFTVFNKSTTAALLFTFFAGDGNIEYNYVRQPRTRLKSTHLNTLAAGTSQLFSGVDTGQRRKHIIVTNFDPSITLRIRDVDDVTVASACFPQRQIIIETDADLRIVNPGATGVEAAVAELFYITL